MPYDVRSMTYKPGDILVNKKDGKKAEVFKTTTTQERTKEGVTQCFFYVLILDTGMSCIINGELLNENYVLQNSPLAPKL